jgi:hypothetical protein
MPGTDLQNYLAGALELRAGATVRCDWFRRQVGPLLNLLKLPNMAHPARHCVRGYVVVGNARFIRRGSLRRSRPGSTPHPHLAPVTG